MGGFTMDQAFVQAPEHRPKPTVVEGSGIPVIDLSPLTATISEDDTAGVDALAAEVGAACREWGFFVAVCHGVPAETVARAVAAQRAFFALPAERKAAVRRVEAAQLGYYESENTNKVRDWKEVFDFAPHELPPGAVADGELVSGNWWPEKDLPDFRETMEEYARAMDDLAFKLLGLIARSLNLRPDRLHGFFKDRYTSVRLNHYPPCPNPDLALGVGGHKDCSALTILFQDDVGGLDVKRRSDGEWVRVNPVPNSFIINVGDIIQVWSNDRYESPEHRVSVNSEKERFSIGYFFNTANSTMVEPLEELVSEENPARYKAYNLGEFYNIKNHSNFKKMDVDNVQIAHFRKEHN